MVSACVTITQTYCTKVPMIYILFFTHFIRSVICFFRFRVGRTSERSILLIPIQFFGLLFIGHTEKKENKIPNLNEKLFDKRKQISHDHPIDFFLSLLPFVYSFIKFDRQFCSRTP